jgi:hypothetical protein
MVICETTPREMICKKWTEESTCTSCLITTPPPGEVEEIVIRRKVAPVAMWTKKQVKSGVTKTGKPRRVRAYKITGRPEVFARDPFGDVVALRFLKRSFGPDRFTARVTEKKKGSRQ